MISPRALTLVVARSVLTRVKVGERPTSPSFLTSCLGILHPHGELFLLLISLAVFVIFYNLETSVTNIHGTSRSALRCQRHRDRQLGRLDLWRLVLGRTTGLRKRAKQAAKLNEPFAPDDEACSRYAGRWHPGCSDML